jgi:hypothetical protein
MNEAQDPYLRPADDMCASLVGHGRRIPVWIWSDCGDCPGLVARFAYAAWSLDRGRGGRQNDAQREYAYGPAQGLPDTKVGTFTQALYDEAKKDGWIIISMKNDWKRIFAFE